jgi:hypothetical protein
MVRLIRLGIAAASAMMLTGLANAADMPGLPPPLPSVPVVPVVDWLGTGWYVRGDLGWRSGLIDGADAPRGFADPTQNKLGSGIAPTGPSITPRRRPTPATRRRRTTSAPRSSR